MAHAIGMQVLVQHSRDAQMENGLFVICPFRGYGETTTETRGLVACFDAWSVG